MNAKIGKEHEIAERLANQKSSILSENEKEAQTRVKTIEQNFHIEGILGYYKIKEQIEKAKSAGYIPIVSNVIIYF